MITNFVTRGKVQDSNTQYSLRAWYFILFFSSIYGGGGGGTLGHLLPWTPGFGLTKKKGNIKTQIISIFCPNLVHLFWYAPGFGIPKRKKNRLRSWYIFRQNGIKECHCLFGPRFRFDPWNSCFFFVGIRHEYRIYIYALWPAICLQKCPFCPFLQKIGGMFRVVGERTHPEPTRKKKGTMINTTNRKIDKKRRKKKKEEENQKPPPETTKTPNKNKQIFSFCFFGGGDGWVVSGALGVLGFLLPVFLLYSALGISGLFLVFLIYSSCCFVFSCSCFMAVGCVLFFCLFCLCFACFPFLFVLSWSCWCMDFNLVFVGGGGGGEWLMEV